MKLNSNQQAFIALVKAGLWERDARLSTLGDIDLMDIYRIAEEQSVVGIIAAGLEHINDVKLPKEDILQFVGQALQLEQRNIAMNAFIAKLIAQLRSVGINALLVKGQGIAQCYEKPLWRSCGDVDLLLDSLNYEKAKILFDEKGYQPDEEETERLHKGYYVNGWLVELHGTLHTRCWNSLDRQIDAVQEDTVLFNNVRNWICDENIVFLPSADNDVIIVFTHILQHFYKGGIGLRQICDLCRLLWTFRDTIDVNKLGFRLRAMDLLSEWFVFSALMIDYLGLPSESMPLYSSKEKWKRKATRVLKHIYETGNFGHNRDMGYIHNKPYVIRKLISFWRSTWDRIRQSFIFPLDSFKVWVNMFSSHLLLALRGK